MDLDALLLKTSRSLARTLPLLPEPTATEISLGWLLFRAAGVFEDATDWSRERRLEGLERLVELLEAPLPQQGAFALGFVLWVNQQRPERGLGGELLDAMPALLAKVATLAPAVRELVLKHTARSAEGMARFVARTNGKLVFSSVAEIREHCQSIAGVFGELLTQLLLHDCAALRHDTAKLRSCMIAFGEGLRLVRLLRSVEAGRVVLTESLPRETVAALALEDLDRATSYVRVLQQSSAPRGYRVFCAATLMIGFRTLATLTAQAGRKPTVEELDRLVALAGEVADEESDLRALALR
ncbi:MAG: squalene/phytoene synthase family protein [Myxococcota bacterium]